MSEIMNSGTLKILPESCILRREMTISYGNGCVSIRGDVVGRYNEFFEVFNDSNVLIGRVADYYYDISLISKYSIMDAGRAYGCRGTGYIENARHDRMADYNGPALGASAAIICAMYLGFLGTDYENFFRN